MSRDCTQFRDQFSPYLDGELTASEARIFEKHVGGCDECRELLDSCREIIAVGHGMEDLVPPPHLAAEIADSPCRRWLGLLFTAVDREISETNLERLFQHLESCPSCRGAWTDIALMHQVGDALEAPDHLLARCLRPRRPFSTRKILGRRTATAAAYSLAILASLAIGNPVTLARYEAASPVERAIKTGISEATETGRSEARVMLWRAIQLGKGAAEAARTTWDRWTTSDKNEESVHLDDDKETTP